MSAVVHLTLQALISRQNDFQSNLLSDLEDVIVIFME